MSGIFVPPFDSVIIVVFLGSWKIDILSDQRLFSHKSEITLPALVQKYVFS